MGVAADGSYGISDGVVYSYPVRCKNGGYEIVQNLEIDEFGRQKMAATDKELREERAGVEGLL
jgi:malate dehydrogenase